MCNPFKFVKDVCNAYQDIKELRDLSYKYRHVASMLLSLLILLVASILCMTVLNAMLLIKIVYYL